MATNLSKYKERWIACVEGIPIDKNPYENSSEIARTSWITGWLACHNDWKNRK